MKPSLKVGFGFGVTSGIITTLGLIVGLQAGTHSRSVVIGGILTIAIADTFSDALGFMSLKNLWRRDLRRRYGFPRSQLLLRNLSLQ